MNTRRAKSGLGVGAALLAVATLAGIALWRFRAPEPAAIPVPDPRAHPVAEVPASPPADTSEPQSKALPPLAQPAQEAAPPPESTRNLPAVILNREWVAKLQELIASDPRAALSYCRSLSPEKQNMAFHMLFAAWARKDPAAAYRAAQTLSGDLRKAMMELTLRLWALSNPEAAMAMLAAGTDLSDDVRNRVTQAAVSALGQSDPVAALDALAAADRVDAAARERLTAELLGNWIATDTLTALAWMRDSNIDEATYNRAIVSAVARMTATQGAEAAALFTEFVASGRMDAMADPQLYSATVWAAKNLGATLGGTDYSSALAWGFELPADSAAQAYVLSNVAFSQTHGPSLPEMPWVAEMSPGFARDRVVTAVAYGRLLATGDTTPAAEVKRQLDTDALDTARLKVIVEQSPTLPTDEKQSLLSWL